MRGVIGLQLLAISAACAAAGLLVSEAKPMLAIGGLGFVCALILLLRRSKAAAPRWAILDGSNVMHWKDETPRLDAVQEVIIHLERRGYSAGVVFDANAGYLLTGKYQHDDKLALRLSIPEKNVLVVNKGEPADPRILSKARDMGAIVVTSDRDRDWESDFPEVRTPGHLVRGGYRDGKLWLKLPTD